MSTSGYLACRRPILFGIVLLMPVDEQHLVQTLLREQPRLMAYIRSMVISRDLAEDVFQEVSLAACGSRESIESTESLPGWLRIVARNKAVAAIRKHKASRAVVLDNATLDLLESDWDRLDYNASLCGRSDQLERCLDLLPDKSRRLIDLKYRDNLSGAQIASQTSRSINSIYMALVRIREALGRCIREGEVANES